MAERDPRRLGDSLSRVIADQAPKTLLADVQRVWAEACGEAIAAAAEPVSERRGRVTIACESGAWAQELELISGTLLARLEPLVGENRITGLRFTADLSRHR
ncbi:MAG TPA: DciA family protein [Solirubrobacterales bacterium]|nr:DciA family protein [Solirubrobacterales bacterium]